MKRILYITDLFYKANGRNYYEEDLFIISKLKKHFNIIIGHPQQAIENLHIADLIVYRNTGAVLGYENYYRKFVSEVKKQNIHTFNSFDGKADMVGKDYLMELTQLDFPVIPTVENISDLKLLGNPEQYIVKLKNGADSIGMEVLNKNELERTNLENKIIQPFVNFEYEISFYYINQEFQYALYAPDKSKRWELEEIAVTSKDLEFANKFIEWNTLSQGITRVDACRLKNGSLLLVELEDLNPFLSLQRASKSSQNLFLNNFTNTLNTIIH
ncbi:hypothetical protein [Tenacibaculum sp. SDUM215027]|uniref:hypothetical protein n=1 Tax=Tenacibaculum sp. SDUM215027 TaxID=3422596 RepID=UPI003D3202E8